VTSLACLGRAPFTGDLETTWQDLLGVVIPAADAGQLRVRLVMYTPLPMWRRTVAHMAAYGHAHPSGWLFWGGVKEFADGSLGARTALMWAPYADDAGHQGGSGGSAEQGYGTRMIGLAELRELVAGADAAGLQVAVHAIGDRSVDEVADVFASVQAANAHLHDPANADATPPPRHRIEHAQHIAGNETAAKLAAARITTTPNPLHLAADAPLLERRLGGNRGGPRHAYPFDVFRDLGVDMGMATDWPVVDLDLVGSVYVAAYRVAPEGGAASGPRAAAHPACSGREQCEAARARLEWSLAGHTLHAARAANLEDWVGALRPGLRADFAVFDRSPMDLAHGGALPSVLATWVDGRCGYGCTHPVSAAHRPAAAAAA